MLFSIDPRALHSLFCFFVAVFLSACRVFYCLYEGSSTLTISSEFGDLPSVFWGALFGGLLILSFIVFFYLVYALVSRVKLLSWVLSLWDDEGAVKFRVGAVYGFSFFVVGVFTIYPGCPWVQSLSVEELRWLVCLLLMWPWVMYVLIGRCDYFKYTSFWGLSSNYSWRNVYFFLLLFICLSLCFGVFYVDAVGWLVYEICQALDCSVIIVKVAYFWGSLFNIHFFSLVPLWGVVQHHLPGPKTHWEPKGVVSSFCFFSSLAFGVLCQVFALFLVEFSLMGVVCWGGAWFLPGFLVSCFFFLRGVGLMVWLLSAKYGYGGCPVGVLALSVGQGKSSFYHKVRVILNICGVELFWFCWAVLLVLGIFYCKQAVCGPFGDMCDIVVLGE